MSTTWREEEEELKVGGAKGGVRSKPRFSFMEVKMLLEAVKRNRFIILRRFNQGVSAEVKKSTWAEITNQINGLGENHREVRQIMKKWADLKCDGKRRIAALKGPNGTNMRKKNLGAVEKMVHKILMMSPSGDLKSDQELDDDDDWLKINSRSLSPANYSYLSLTDSSLPAGAPMDLSPLSSPEKEAAGEHFHSSSEFDVDQAEDGDQNLDLDENDDSLFSSSMAPPPPSRSDLLADDALPLPALRTKPVHTYSRSSSQNQNQTKTSPGPSSSSADSDAVSSTELTAAAAAVAPPPPPAAMPTSQSPPSKKEAPPPSSADSASQPSSSSKAPPAPPASSRPSAAPSSSAAAASSSPPPPPPSSSTPPPPSGADPWDRLPAGASARGGQQGLGQLAASSLQQQRAGRLLLGSVSRSMEALAQSLQLLVETQQEFVQESLLLQRETVDILRDFSNTTLTVLRDKAGHQGAQHQRSGHY